jgi:hypothetical protein
MEPELKTCPHCGTKGILLMTDGKCPNCKKLITPVNEPQRDAQNYTSIGENSVQTHSDDSCEPQDLMEDHALFLQDEGREDSEHSQTSEASLEQGEYDSTAVEQVQTINCDLSESKGYENDYKIPVQTHKPTSESILWIKNKRRKSRKLPIIFGCLLVITVFISYVAYRWIKFKPLFEAQIAFSHVKREYIDAYTVKKWDAVIEIYEKKLLDNMYFKKSRHKSNVAELLFMWDFIVAEAYFNKQRYKEACEAQRRFIDFAESHPQETGLGSIQYGYIALARYASFAYAKTGEVLYKDEVEDQIKKAHALIRQYEKYDLPMKSDSVGDRYRRFGAMKYRLDTRQMVSDEEWQKNFGVTPCIRYIVIWLAKVAPGSYPSVSKEDNLWYTRASYNPSEIWVPTEQVFEKMMKNIEQTKKK